MMIAVIRSRFMCALCFFLALAPQAFSDESAYSAIAEIAEQPNFYVGGSLGFGELHINGTTLKADGTVGASATEESAQIQDSFYGLGAFIGAHKDFNDSLYLGVEADWMWLGQKDQFYNIIDNNGPYQGDPSVEITYNTYWISTFRGRVGLPFDRALLYATGGLAISAEDESRSQYKGDGVSDTYLAFSDNSDVIRLGYSVGAGLEWKVSDTIFIRSEYIYASFSKETFTFPNARGGAGASYFDVQGRLARNKSEQGFARFSIGYSF